MRDKSLLSSAAAVAGVLAASSCCLPIIPLWLAAGSAGAGLFLAKARPYLMTLSVLLIAYGFWSAARARQCTRRRRTINLGLLTVSGVFVGVSLLFPQLMANWMAGASVAATDGQPALSTFTASRGFDVLIDRFNQATPDQIQVVAMFSPT